jgi:hypothetical protein
MHWFYTWVYLLYLHPFHLPSPVLSPLFLPTKLLELMCVYIYIIQYLVHLFLLHTHTPLVYLFFCYTHTLVCLFLFHTLLNIYFCFTHTHTHTHTHTLQLVLPLFACVSSWPLRTGISSQNKLQSKQTRFPSPSAAIDSMELLICMALVRFSSIYVDWCGLCRSCTAISLRVCSSNIERGGGI